jgi:hypothetical protein
MKILKYLPLIGIALFIYIISRLDLSEIAEVLLSANPYYLLLALFISPIPIFLQGLKWNMLMRTYRMRYPLKDTCILWLIGLFAGMTTPGRIGELTRAFYLNKEGYPLEKAIFSVLGDRIIELFSLAFLGIFGITYLFFWFNINLVSLLIVILICFILFALLSRKDIVAWLARPFFNKFVPESKKRKVQLTFDDFYNQLYQSAGEKTIIVIFFIALVVWMTFTLQWYFLALSLNLGISYLYLLAITPILVVAIVLPISISGLGTREAIYIFFLAQLGISAVNAVSFSLIALIFSWVPASFGGLLWLIYPKK